MEGNLVNEIRHLHRTRFAPIVACLQDGPIAEELRYVGARVHLLPYGRLRNLPRSLLRVWRLVRLIRRYDVSLVISQNSLAHIYGRIAGILTRRPVVLRSGGVSEPLDRVDRIAYALGAAVFIANSRFTQRALVAAGIPLNRVRVVYPGVSLSDFDSVTGPTLRNGLGLSSEALIVTTIGRLQWGKGQHVALSTAAQVVHQCPKSQFLIVGDALFGIEKDYPLRLRSLIAELNLTDHVKMLGHRSDVPAILAASDIVLVPSVYPEGFGMVTVEAMAAAKPVVATDTGASPEIITQGETGLLVPPNSPEALGEAIMRLLANRELRHAMGVKGQQVVRQRFTVERAVSECEQLYLESLESTSFDG
jgi:glycosyltransferase involved in cell wall biosynthesis